MIPFKDEVGGQCGGICLNASSGCWGGRPDSAQYFPNRSSDGFIVSATSKRLWKQRERDLFSWWTSHFDASSFPAIYRCFYSHRHRCELFLPFFTHTCTCARVVVTQDVDRWPDLQKQVMGRVHSSILDHQIWLCGLECLVSQAQECPSPYGNARIKPSSLARITPQSLRQ